MASKRGLAWPATNQEPIFPFTKPGSRISWLYNWSPSPPPGPPLSLAFVPMAWNDVHLPELRDRCGGGSGGGGGGGGDSDVIFPTILAFNEPDLPSQANMPVELAVTRWMEVLEPLRRGEGEGGRRRRIGSPAIASTEAGIAWLQAFTAGIRQRGGDVDFWCLHWYGETLGQFYDYIWSTHHRLGPDKPVWITEYACTNWNVEAPMPRAQVETFARDSAKYLDTLDWVERYCWFGAMRDAGTVGRWARMIDDDGTLTPLGKEYRDG